MRGVGTPLEHPWYSRPSSSPSDRSSSGPPVDPGPTWSAEMMVTTRLEPSSEVSTWHEPPPDSKSCAMDLRILAATAPRTIRTSFVLESSLLMADGSTCTGGAARDIVTSMRRQTETRRLDSTTVVFIVFLAVVTLAPLTALLVPGCAATRSAASATAAEVDKLGRVVVSCARQDPALRLDVVLQYLARIATDLVEAGHVDFDALERDAESRGGAVAQCAFLEAVAATTGGSAPDATRPAPGTAGVSSAESAILSAPAEYPAAAVERLRRSAGNVTWDVAGRGLM